MDLNFVLSIVIAVASSLVWIVRQEGKTNLIRSELEATKDKCNYLVLEGVKFKDKQHEFDRIITRMDEKQSQTLELLHSLADKLKNCKECGI